MLEARECSHHFLDRSTWVSLYLRPCSRWGSNTGLQSIKPISCRGPWNSFFITKQSSQEQSWGVCLVWILHGASQEKLFKVAGLPMVENCMAGYNSCMFAYGQVQIKILCSGPLMPSPRSFQYFENPQRFGAGQILEFLETLLSSVACSEFLLQTGSGKTHTMLGDIEHLENKPSDNRGMTPRVFEYLFARIRRVIICLWICCLHCICFCCSMWHTSTWRKYSNCDHMLSLTCFV